MDGLTKTVGNLKERIEVHRADLSKNETMTRYALVDPLLRELGWDLSDPSDVVPEDGTGAGSRTDYTMSPNAMIVEAKKLDVNLDKYTEKLTEYVRDKGVRYGVLTNGQKWRLYDSQNTMKSLVTEFDITDSEGVVISGAIQLHRSVILDSIPRKPVTKGKAASKTEGPDVRILGRPGNEKLLVDIKYVKGMSPPKELVCLNKSVSLSSWVDVLVGVANWLVTNGHLGKSHCPVPIGSKNAILNTTPFHQNGKPFSTQEEMGGLYLNTNASPSNALRHAIKLIKTAGLKPSDFKTL